MEPRRLLSLTPPALGGDASVHPADFRVTVFAQGLQYPTGVTTAADGSLLVVTNTPNNHGTNFYDSTTQVVRLVDSTGDGVADGTPQVLADGLPGASSAIVRAGSYVVVTSSGGTISFLRTGATPGASLTLAGSIRLNFPSGWWHPTFALAARPTPGQPGAYDVFFNIGSQNNGIKKDAQGNILFDQDGVAIPDPTTDKVPATGLLSATLDGDAISMVTLTDHAGTPTLSGLTKVATGLRNAASMAIDPATGDLIYADNGIDGTDGGNESYSTDTLQRIAAADIGKTVPNDGFPYSYTLTNLRPGGQPNTVVNPGGRVTPRVSFQPLADPNLPATGSESEGAAGFAIAPPRFPAALNKGVFVGFHGVFNQGGTTNEENPVLFADPITGKYFDFISNNEPNIGHIDGATSTADSLFLTDVAPNGQVFGAPGTGVVYQVKAISQAPAFGAISNQVVNEGQTIHLSLTATDPDAGQTLTYSLAAGTPAGATIDPATGLFTWTPPDGPSTALVTVLATDAGTPSLQGSASFSITVNNAAPTVSVMPPPSKVSVGTFNGSGSFSDPGVDTWTATVNYGDKKKSTRLALASDRTFKLSHRYTRRGTYTVTVKVTDSDGAAGTHTIKVVVGPRKAPPPKGKHR
jgi:glucose/arabinose dehydrogenase